MLKTIDEFEFTDDNNLVFKVKKMDDGNYWLWRKLPDSRFVSVRKLNNISFNDEATEIQKMYERHCKQNNSR